jgi:exonuclease III
MAGESRPNPRKRFIQDLITEIKKQQQTGADIILGGDFNERLGEPKSTPSHRVRPCGHPCFETRHPGRAQYLRSRL